MYNDPKKFVFMSMRKWDYRGEGGGAWVIRMVIFLSCLCFFVSTNISEAHIDNNWQKIFPFKIAITPSSFIVVHRQF